MEATAAAAAVSALSKLEIELGRCELEFIEELAEFEAR